MKRLNNLYDVIDKPFISKQIDNAVRKKKLRNEVLDVLQNKKAYTDEIYSMLCTLEFELTPLRAKRIYNPHSGKQRDLLIPQFYPDQIIHWCYVQMMMPLFMRGMYRHSYSGIPGRGMMAAQDIVRHWIDTDYYNTQYVAELDVRKFYDNVDQEILYDLISHKCKDKRALQLSQKVITHAPKGLPLGNYTSPWLANFYLQGIDHLIKEELHIPHMVRYMDNYVMFSHSKEQLHEAVDVVENVSQQKLNITYGANKQVYPLEPRGLDFLGLVFHRNYTLLRARNFLALTRQARELIHRIDTNQPVSLHSALSCNCRIAFCRRANHHNILTKYMPTEYEMELRKIISKQMRKEMLLQIGGAI